MTVDHSGETEGNAVSASTFARATLVESRSLEHARTLGAARLGLRSSEVELDILERPGPHRETFLVRVLAFAVGKSLAGDLTAIEKRLGALPHIALDTEMLADAAARPGEYDDALLEKALAEVDELLEGTDAASVEVFHSIKQLSISLKPELRDRLADLRLEAVQREEAASNANRSRDGGIDIQVQAHRREAYLTFRPPQPGGRPLTEADALKAISDLGCIPPSTADLARVIARIREPRAGHCMLTLTFRPGRFVLQITPDEMELTLALYPPGGAGEAVTDAKVLAAIRDRRIRVNVDEDAIRKAVRQVNEEKQPLFDLVIASGRLAEPGIDSELTWKIPAVLDEDGFWNLDPEAEAIVVDKGHVLATSTESRNGSPGMTVLGRPLPSSKGKPCPIITGPSVRKDGQGQFLATGPGRVGLRRNILGVSPFEPARAELVIDQQKTRAELALIPAVGAAPGLGIEAVETLLAERGVSFCVDYELILDLLKELKEKKRRVSGVIAVGVPPLVGRPGFLDVPVHDLVTEMQMNEQMDHKERSAIRAVHAGDTVGIWYPADPGSPGIDINGREVPQPAIMDEPATAGTGVERDGPIYRATRNGHLVVGTDCLSVEDVYHVRGDLTMAVGNIRHHGSVIIDGNVGDNFILQAAGELVIRDNLGGSQVTATGNVRIGNGFIGRQKGVIRAGGDVQAKFVEQARVTARGALRIHQNALHSRLESEGMMEILGARAGIVGGTATSRAGIRTAHAGSSAHIPTILRVGVSPALDQRAAFLDDEFQRLLSDLAKLEQLESALKDAQSGDALAPVATVPGTAAPGASEAMRRILSSRLALKARLKDTGVERIRVARDRQGMDPAEIVVTGTVHPGVTIGIGATELHLNTTLQAVRFTLANDGDQVKFSPIN